MASASRDPRARRRLLERQWDGLARAVRAGLVVKVNSVLIPGVNDLELPAIAMLAAEYGAHLSNILPLIPQARFRRSRRRRARRSTPRATRVASTCRR